MNRIHVDRSVAMLNNLLWLPGHLFGCYLVWLLVACSRSSRATLSPDGLALLQFKTHITHDPAGRLNGWQASDDTPCAWLGVTCVPSGTGGAPNASVVSQLNLRVDGLEGSLSVSLGSLANLTRLDLNGNSLSGAIPNFGALTNLTSLDIAWNDLSGDIGTLGLERLTQLELLDLSNNRISGAIPNEIVNCKLLTRLDLSSNWLYGSLPDNMSQLTNLIFLDLSENDLSGDIDTLGGSASLMKWEVLRVLRLEGNQFTGTLPNMSGLKNLEFLSFDGKLTGGKIPDLSASREVLSELRMRGAQLEGPLPTWIGNMPRLQTLDLSSNNLKIAPGMWINGTAPGFLDLSGNQISGTISSYFAQLSVRQLNLSNNRLTGNIPASVNASALLSSLDLSNNELDGPIPTWIMSSSILRSLHLQNNRLYGDIASAWSFEFLEGSSGWALELQGNQLSGNVGAATCASWAGLELLDLSHNSGVNLVNNSLELMLTNFSGLQGLHLSNIGSSGRLVRPKARAPTARTIDSPLRELDLSVSNLEGDLSQSIFAQAHLLFTRLESLNLSGNRLTGQVPPGLAVIPNLRVLDLSNNRLSGPLPPFPPHLQNATFFAGNPELCGFPLKNACKPPKSLVLPLALALVGCCLLFAVSCVLFGWRLRNSNIRRQQDAELIDMMKGKNSANLMPLAELRKATSNFSQESEIGVGGFGTVYKGKLKDGTWVAIKRSKRQGSQQDKEQFLNEVNILSHVNHRNLVRLLGCCLENKVALLVFEYVPSGTLQQHLSRKSSITARALTWEERLRIAMQTADALDYLHSAANPPIFHRDVKSANILLDEDMNAKVADFGISKLVPLDATHVWTKGVQGTIGYIDPEYYTRFKLSAKSDVYSFGVVLLELISAQGAVDLRRDPEEAALSTFATSLIRNGNLEDLVDPAIAHIFTDSDAGKDSIAEVAALAVKCLHPRSRDRPSMFELSKDLRALWHQLDPTGGDDRGQQGSGPDHNEHIFSVDSAFLSEASLLASYFSGR